MFDQVFVVVNMFICVHFSDVATSIITHSSVPVCPRTPIMTALALFVT